MTFEGKNMDEIMAGQRMAEVPVEGLHVVEWMPERDGNGTPTQVHVYMPLPADIQVVVRFKSQRTLDKFIAALTVHRNNVWPPERD